MTDREGNVWLWQDGNGCRKVDVYKRQTVYSTPYHNYLTDTYI